MEFLCPPGIFQIKINFRILTFYCLILLLFLVIWIHLFPLFSSNVGSGINWESFSFHFEWWIFWEFFLDENWGIWRRIQQSSKVIPHFKSSFYYYFDTAKRKPYMFQFTQFHHRQKVFINIPIISAQISFRANTWKNILIKLSDGWIVDFTWKKTKRKIRRKMLNNLVIIGLYFSRVSDKFLDSGAFRQPVIQ